MYDNNNWTERYGDSYAAGALAWSENGTRATIYATGVTADEADAKLMDALRELKLIPEANDECFLVFAEDTDNFGVVCPQNVEGFAAGPAIQEFEQEDATSGDAEPAAGISNAGDNNDLAPTVSQSANSGNVLNGQGVVLSGSEVETTWSSKAAL